MRTGPMQADAPGNPNEPRRLWTLERPDGEVLSCDIEPAKPGWMVWFSVNGQRVGGHRFDTRSMATAWADLLLSELPPPSDAVSYARR